MYEHAPTKEQARILIEAEAERRQRFADEISGRGSIRADPELIQKMLRENTTVRLLNGLGHAGPLLAEHTIPCEWLPYDDWLCDQQLKWVRAQRCARNIMLNLGVPSKFFPRGLDW